MGYGFSQRFSQHKLLRRLHFLAPPWVKFRFIVVVAHHWNVYVQDRLRCFFLAVKIEVRMGLWSLPTTSSSSTVYLLRRLEEIIVKSGLYVFLVTLLRRVGKEFSFCKTVRFVLWLISSIAVPVLLLSVYSDRLSRQAEAWQLDLAPFLLPVHRCRRVTNLNCLTHLLFCSIAGIDLSLPSWMLVLGSWGLKVGFRLDGSLMGAVTLHRCSKPLRLWYVLKWSKVGP